MTVHDDLQRVQEALPGADVEAHRALSRVHVEIARLEAAVSSLMRELEEYKAANATYKHQGRELRDAQAEVARLRDGLRRIADSDNDPLWGIGSEVDFARVLLADQDGAA